MKKFFLSLLLIITMFPSFCFSNGKILTLDDLGFSSDNIIHFIDDSQSVSIYFNNCIFTPLLAVDDQPDYKNSYYFFTSKGSLGQLSSYIGLSGFAITLTNHTDSIKIINWNSSILQIGSRSFVPLLDGVKLKDAGNPSVLPNTILPPRQQVSLQVCASNVSFRGGSWHLGGTLIPVENNLSAALYLKISNDDGVSKMYTIASPTIGRKYYPPQKSTSFFNYSFKK